MATTRARSRGRRYHSQSARAGSALPQSVNQPLARAATTPLAHRTHTARTLPGAMEEGKDLNSLTLTLTLTLARQPVCSTHLVGPT
eukprot:scaffold38240_cov63-Phaeocystis_antarctica.AAC.2